MTGGVPGRGGAGKAFAKDRGVESGADAGFRSRSGVGWSVVKERLMEKGKRINTPRRRTVRSTVEISLVLHCPDLSFS